MKNKKLVSIDFIISQFDKWLNDAKNNSTIAEYNAFNLATADKKGKPSNRTVLLKEYNPKGFVFYTNLKSQKGVELMDNPLASMCFFWDPLFRQIRITGSIELVDNASADNYFDSRDYRSRIGALISKQSQRIESYPKLQFEFAKKVAQFSIQSEIKRPKWWSGFRLIPENFEFWQKGDFRIHRREVYEKQSEVDFSKHYLYP